VPAFPEENEEKTETTSITLAVSPVEIRTRHFEKYKISTRLLH